MASEALFSIGGIASGLDTTAIIEQMMALERQPVRRLEQQQADLAHVKDAWAQVTTKLSTLRSATDKLTSSSFDAMTSVTSSDEAAVSVASSGRTGTGSVSFRVVDLARRMQSTSQDAFASTEATLDGRTLEVTDAAGVSHDLTAGLAPDATLEDLIAAVNAADIAVRASALQVAPDEYQLVLEAEETGTAAEFTVTATGTTGWTNAFVTTQTAGDTVLEVGGIQVTRPSNTIDDLVDGATLTLHQTTTSPVSIVAGRNVDGAVAAVTEFVEGVKGVLGTLRRLSDYDPETNTGGPLQGEAVVRELIGSFRRAISRPVTGLDGADALAGTLGIQFDRDGIVQLDETVLRQAFVADFDGTADRLAMSGTTTDAGAAFVEATSATTPGSHDVVVTRAADVARAVGAGFVPVGTAEPKTFRITGPGGDTVRVTITMSETTVTAAVNKINQALAEAGQDDLAASVNGGEIQLESNEFGSAVTFTVEELDADTGTVIAGGTVWGLEGTHAGVDVAGTIGGDPATGAGRRLTGTAGAADGLSIRVEGRPPDFQVTWTRGIVGELSSALSRAEGLDGIVSRAKQSVDDQVELHQDRIDSFERRLETREITIRRQFVAMESMLGQLNQQGNWLGQQLAGLPDGG